jgi:RNA polymerase sigma-70 factor (ECF subfamily)
VTALGHPPLRLGDAELAARVRDGDHAAFRTIYERHVGAIRGYAVGRLGPDGADDIVSETFVIAWRTIDRFDPSATSARPWLYGIATKVLARHREREARWIEQNARHPDRAREATSEPTAYELDPVLARAIGTLSPALRDVLVLSALGDMTVADVARALDLRQSTARVRLLRARRQVRRILEGTDHD